jgi:hypothetical protein
MIDITSFSTQEADIQTYNSGNLGFVNIVLLHWFFFSVVLVVNKGFMFRTHILRFFWGDNSTVEEFPEHDDILNQAKDARDKICRIE